MLATLRNFYSKNFMTTLDRDIYRTLTKNSLIFNFFTPLKNPQQKKF